MHTSRSLLNGQQCQNYSSCRLPASKRRSVASGRPGTRRTAHFSCKAELLADKPNTTAAKQAESSCPFLASLPYPPVARSPWYHRFKQLFAPQEFQRELLEGQTSRMIQVPSQIGMSAVYMPNDVDLVKEVLGGEADGKTTIRAGRQTLNNAIGDLMGRHSVLLVCEPRHKYLRTLMQPAFSPEAIARYVPSIQTLVTKHLGYWEQAGSEGLKGHAAFKMLTIDFIIQVVMGREYTKQEVSDISSLYNTWASGLTAWPWMDIPFTKFHTAMRAREQLMAYIQDGLTAARQAQAAGQEVPGVIGALVAAVDEQGNTLTDVEICDNILLLFFAGHDTSSTTLTQCMSNLQDAPAVVDKLRAEQQKIVAKHGGKLTAAALKDMVYIDAVIRETLRQNPVATSTLPRMAAKDLQLGGYAVPAGTEFHLPLDFLAKTDPRWRGRTDDMDPAVFNPDRMLTPEGLKGGAQMPFGYGPRFCLGYALAMAEMKVFLALLARHYTFTVDNDTAWKQGVGRVPENGLPMVVQRLQSLNQQKVSVRVHWT